MSAVCSHGRDGGEERRARLVIDGPHSELRVWAEANHVFFPSPNVARLHLRPGDKPVCGEQTRESRI